MCPRRFCVHMASFYSPKVDRSARASSQYERVQYLTLMRRCGYPLPRRLPRDLRHEAKLLRKSKWLGSIARNTVCWQPVPTSAIDPHTDKDVKLAGDARLCGDSIYVLSEDQHLLFRFAVGVPDRLDSAYIQADQDTEQDQVLDTVCFSFGDAVAAYDVDGDANIVAALVKSPRGLQVCVRHLDSPSLLPIAEEDLGQRTEYVFTEIAVISPTVLISLDSDLHSRSWQGKRFPNVHGKSHFPEIWRRPPPETETTFARASLLSAEVVACVVVAQVPQLDASENVVELYRLDQQVPRVADIMIRSPSPGWRVDEQRMTYVDLGGKRGLEECRARGLDGIAVISIRHVTVRRGCMCACLSKDSPLEPLGRFAHPLPCISPPPHNGHSGSAEYRPLATCSIPAPHSPSSRLMRRCHLTLFSALNGCEGISMQRASVPTTRVVISYGIPSACRGVVLSWHPRTMGSMARLLRLFSRPKTRTSPSLKHRRVSPGRARCSGCIGWKSSCTDAQRTPLLFCPPPVLELPALPLRGGAARREPSRMPSLAVQLDAPRAVVCGHQELPVSDHAEPGAPRRYGPVASFWCTL